MLLYEGRDVVAQVAAAASDTIVVSFSSFHQDGDAPPFARKFVSSSGMAGVSIISRHPHWWQTEEMHPLCEAVAKICSAYSRRIGYGSSMGAFGALLWADSLGLTDIIAVAPQTSLGGPLKPAWQKAIEGVKIVRDDIGARLSINPVVIYDPCEPLDSWHVRHLSERRAITPIKVFCGTHMPLRVLSEAECLSSALYQLMSTGNIQAFRSAMRAARPKSQTWLISAAITSLMRGRNRTALALLSRLPPDQQEYARRQARLLRLR